MKSCLPGEQLSAVQEGYSDHNSDGESDNGDGDLESDNEDVNDSNTVLGACDEQAGC